MGDHWEDETFDDWMREMSRKKAVMLNSMSFKEREKKLSSPEGYGELFQLALERGFNNDVETLERLYNGIYEAFDNGDMVESILAVENYVSAAMCLEDKLRADEIYSG